MLTCKPKRLPPRRTKRQLQHYGMRRMLAEEEKGAAVGRALERSPAHYVPVAEEANKAAARNGEQNNSVWALQGATVQLRVRGMLWA
jgi:hypothetical protein